MTKSKPNKDFGKGFYLSEDEEQAIEMARYKSSILGGDVVITKFKFNIDALNCTELKVKIFSEYSEEWADFVLANRDGKQTEGYDVVYGPIANDKVGLQIRKLKDGSIDKQEFLNRLKYMKGITSQYYFGTENAIKYLRKYE